MADSDDGYQSQRESHYNQQRSSFRSDKSVQSPSRPQSAQLTDYALPENYANLNEVAAPPPVENPVDSAIYRHQSLEDAGAAGVVGAGGKRKKSGKGGRATATTTATATATREDYAMPDAYDNLNEVASPSPIENPCERSFYSHHTLEEERAHSRGSRGERRAQQRSRSSHHPSPLSRRGTDFSVTALPPILDNAGGHHHQPKELTSSDEYIASKPTPRQQRASRFATQLYTISYLIIFSILGTLARLGLQWLTFYPGAPVLFSELWANVTGTLFMGFLSEDRQLFRDEWGKAASNSIPSLADDEEKAIDLATAKASHAKVKKTIPLYIGLATGFCGSFTSFSSFIRDLFFALSNDLPSPINHPYPAANPISTTSTIPRNGGYSFMAVCAVIIITVALCYSALKVGAHLAIYLEPLTPRLPFPLLRKIIDRTTVVIAFGTWLGAVLMAIWPPDRPGGPSSHGSWARETWRGQAVSACVFAPVGCLLRFYLSLQLNGLISSFPLGTFCVNIFGTAVLGMAFDLQHVRLDSTGLAGGGRVGCQVLQGIMDGFCGALTTVSTWITELNGLRRGHSYVYGTVSVVSGLGILVIVMGSVRWTVGWTVVASVS
ncbi:uncharacterized protein BDR25DRAFT_304873 [Lindgomyces ingoldianus]|uniref:Uncharacterized protein n=1 Tax=Lindgomyces ingoldianus TaxID=673940 RepID=A0ACB6QS24_9PLEO|nr:uncharacterized protein BDR25DRAFT_304873 [Lindgomyces ingoldianus]KAF2468981.1 hypothetical protein BDR25DRAFT_304873 [Lindgomyces ingoldianus]